MQMDAKHQHSDLFDDIRVPAETYSDELFNSKQLFLT